MIFTVHTYGCQMNVRDSEATRALLEAAGHRYAEHENEADLVIVNSCSVRGKAEDKAIGKIGLLCASKKERPGRIIGLMGCMAQRLGDAIFEKVPKLDFTVGTRRNGAIPRMVDRVLNGEHGISELGSADDIPDSPEAHTDNGFSAFVTILLGCNRRCAYCIVPDVRGTEYSRPAKEILAEIGALASHGVREVTLLGQSVMNYGLRNEVWAPHEVSSGGYVEPFVRLLEAVAANPEIRRIRFTSGHPSGCTSELVKLAASEPKICRHLHLPVQSGSDRILETMRRGYTRADYLRSVKMLRDAMPDFTLTTDVIVGFPGETESDFELTRSLMEEAGFDNAFIFKYSSRPGTPAADMPDDVSDDEKMRRNQVLLADQDLRGARLNGLWVRQVVEVLVEGPSPRNAERWSGRSSGNKIVVFEPKDDLTPGSMVRVLIEKAAPQTLYGKIVGLNEGAA